MEHQTELTQFEQLMNPIDIMVTLIYKRELTFTLDVLFSKYGNNSLTTSGSMDELEQIIKRFVTRILKLLAMDYLKKIQCVLNYDGLIYYIYTQLYALSINILKEKLETNYQLKKGV